MTHKYKGTQKGFSHYFNSEVLASDEFEGFERDYPVRDHSPKTKVFKKKKAEQANLEETESVITDSFEDPINTSFELENVNPHSKEFKRYVRGIKKTLLELKNKIQELNSMVEKDQLEKLLGLWTIEKKPAEEAKQIPREVTRRLEELKRLKRKLARQRDREKERKWREEFNEKIVL